MSDEEKLGSPYKPLKIKCTSMGLEPGLPYVCYVLTDGRKLYLSANLEQVELLHYQTGRAIDTWPADKKR